MSGAAGSSSPFAPVPAEFLGVWQRTLLEGSGRETDTSSAVFWLQTPHWHGDVRIPAHRPDFAGCHAIADCTPQQRRWLATQKGFAGITEVNAVDAADGTTLYCQWHRQVDFQPQGAGRDFGRMVFSDGGRIVDEFGVDADYRERWERLAQSLGPSGAWHKARAPGCFADLLLVAGGCFFYLRDRTQVLLPGGDLLAVAERVDSALLLDMELSFGRWDGMTRVGAITRSTLPWREGQTIADRADWSALA